MRLFLDVETTGLEVTEGDRIIEVGMVREDGQEQQWYFNPGREVSSESAKIHGITDDFLKDKPKFKDKAAELLEFMKDCTLVAHNAQFDLKFLNNELGLIELNPLGNEVDDTLIIAQQKFPNEKHSLDALCTKFGVDISGRIRHGALTDARLLSMLYPGLTAAVQVQGDMSLVASPPRVQQKVDFEKRSFRPAEEELAAHREFMKGIKNSLWH